MKKNCFLLFLFLSLSFLFSIPLSFASLPLSHLVFVIDPGHGGVDPGSVVDGIYEKEINLKISQVLKNELQLLGATVYMTREGDYDLSYPNAYLRKKSDFDERISFIQEKRPDYYLSIHLNYLEDSSYYGPQVFYSSVNSKNYELAQTLQERLNSSLGTNRKIKKISSFLYMYSKIKTPGVLIECGFLSNLEERKKLMDDEYIHKFASVIAQSFNI